MFGPAGHPGSKESAYFPSTRQFVELLFGRRRAFSYLQDFAGHITFARHNLTPQSQPQKIVQSDGLVITAISGHHRDAPSIIYRVDFGGKSVTFTCDIDSAGHDNLRRIARDTDLLVFHCVVLDPPGSPSVLYTLHTAPKDLGMIADQDKAKQLMLGHLHPTIDEAQDAVLTSVSNGYKGSVTLAKDGLRIVP